MVRLWSPVISFCRCYGVIPLKKCSIGPYFSRCTGSYCLSLFLSLNLLFNLLLAAYGFIKSFEESLIKSLQNVTYVIFFFHCELTLIFFFLNAGSLLGLFEQWIETEKTLAGFNIRFGKKTMIKCWSFYVSTIIISTFDSLSTVFYVSVSKSTFRAVYNLITNLRLCTFLLVRTSRSINF